MRRGIIVVGVILVAALAVWLVRRGRHAGKDVRAGSAASTTATAAASQAQDPAARRAPAWLAQAGVPGRRIAGHVTFEGAPVAGAVVTLHSIPSDASLVPPEVRRTAADGAFDFGMREASVYDLTATAEGRTPATVHLVLADPTAKPPSDQLELQLAACFATVIGDIVDASGNAVPRAHVQRGSSVVAEADANGHYRVCTRHGAVELTYRADGYGAVVLTIDAQGETRRDVVLVPQASVSVRVVRDNDGSPVADALVRVFPQDWAADRPAAAMLLTDADGRAHTDALVPGAYRVFATAEGLTTRAPVGVQASVGVSPEVVVRLEATAILVGKVMSAGKPIAGARVSAIRRSPMAHASPVFSQPDGSFVLPGVPLGDLALIAPPYEVKSPTTVHAPEAKQYDVTIEVSRLASIHGRVTRLGKPVAGASVCCVQRIEGGPQNIESDTDGRYAYEGVPAGTYQIHAQSDDVGAFAEAKKITVETGDDRTLDLELDQAGTIAGVVVDQDGKPVKGVFVRWLHVKTGDVGRAITDEQGRYRAGAMNGRGTYRAAVFPSEEVEKAFATADGSPYPTVDLEDGTSVVENVKLAIDYRRLSIAGHVIDDAGTPVADARVSALASAPGRPPLFHSWQRLPATFTDGDGAFTLGGLATGSYALEARAADGGEAVAPEVAAGTSDVKIQLERPATIEGTLVAFPQQPAIYARPVGGAFKLEPAVIDGDHFRIPNLRPGRYLVDAQTTYEGDARVVEVRTGQTARVTLTARGRGAIDGLVLDYRSKKPVAGVQCHAVLSDDGEQGITNWDLATAPRSAPDGRITFDPAPAGSVDVTCISTSGAWSPPSAHANVTVGGRTSLTLYTVEVEGDQNGTAGIEFDWRVTPPRISALAPQSPAAASGLVPGDLIVGVDGKPLDNLNGAGVLGLIDGRAIGSEVSISVARGKTYTMRVAARTE